MSTFTAQQLHEIRESAWRIAEDEISNRGIYADSPDDRVEHTHLLARWLFDQRDRWASFDEDADTEAYEPVIADFFGESETARAFADFFGV